MYLTDYGGNEWQMLIKMIDSSGQQYQVRKHTPCMLQWWRKHDHWHNPDGIHDRYGIKWLISRVQLSNIVDIHCTDLPHFIILLVFFYSWKCPVSANLNGMLHHHHNLFQILICIWIFCTPLNLISRPTSSFLVHYFLAGNVDLIKMSKYRGARDWLWAQGLYC